MKRILKVFIKSNEIMKRIKKIAEKLRDDYLYKKRVEMIRKHGSVIVQEIETSLNKSGLVYFATCGTLLGLIRENRLLSNDYDMDYGVIIGSSRDWEILASELNRIGFVKIREFLLEGRITEQTYRNKNGVEIDFFGHFVENAFCVFIRMIRFLE